MSQDKKYLSLDYKSGTLFEYSKDQKEGFEKHTSSTGKESYRKYYKYGVEGTLNNIQIRDSNFGKELSIQMDEGFIVNFGINNQKGHVDQFTESVIKVLPSLTKGDALKIAPYNFLPEGEKYSKAGVSISVNGEKVKGLTNAYYKDGKLVKGDVPAVQYKESPLGGKKPSAADQEKKDEYLLEVLAKETERLKWVGSGHNAPVAPQEDSDTMLPF